MLTVADRGEGGDKICQNLADVICERALTEIHEPDHLISCRLNLISRGIKHYPCIVQVPWTLRCMQNMK